MNAPAFSTWLVARRQAKGWSQEQLARKVGVSRAAVAHWEHGRFNPGPQNRQTLERLFR